MFLNIEKKNKESMALVDDEGNRITYEQLTTIMEKIGAQVKPRSLIFVLCKNTVGSMLGYLSFINNSAVPVMLSSEADETFLNELIKTYEPAYIWAPTEKKEAFNYPIECESYGYVLFETKNIPYKLNDMLELCMTTSGTTGSPKFVRYKKGNLEVNAKNVAKAFGWTSGERAICDLGMQYTMGLNVINTHLYVGATVLLTTHNIISGEYWDFVKREKGTSLTGVPFSYDILYRLHFERMDLPFLKTLSQGGGRMTDERFLFFAEYAKKEGKRFIASYGATETAARMSCLPCELAMKKTCSIGKAIPEGELSLVDNEGNEIKEQVAEGELCYKGPNVTLGYAERKEDLLRGDDFKGIYHTGDLAKRDEDGCYYIVGRRSRFIKLLSYRVSLDQTEKLIQQEFDFDCACTGTDNKMIIYITEEGKKSDVLEFITSKIGLYKSLFEIIIVPKIIKNDTGKTKYREMDEWYLN